jgi:CheY-like chemotaxis protein
LVVDDNAYLRILLSYLLEEQGYAVTMAENGRQALALLRAQHFDLLLLDITMPEMNGYQVLESLKTDPTLRHLPVIVISAVDELDSVVRCIELDA